MKQNRILYIEKDEFDRLIFEKFMCRYFPASEYYITDSIADGAVAFSENNFDIVFCNYLTDDGSVFDLFKIVKNKVPVVIVAGLEDKNYLSMTVTHYEYDCLVKPYDRDTFVQIIEKALNADQASGNSNLFPI